MKTVYRIITLIVAISLLACNRPVGKNEYMVCAYIWPSCHDDSLAHQWLWPEGEGEWEIIKKGNPRFEGHYQPRQPLWGYGLDDNPAVVEQWIQTALKYGVNTFVYDWYWYKTPDGYSGPFLESALDNGFLQAASNRKMNFFLMYANHDVKYNYWNPYKWGDKDDMLFNPRVGMDDWKKIVDRVITRYFHLPNYVKIDGCPVFAMFNSTIFKEGFESDEQAGEAMMYFRDKAREAGFPGVWLQLTPGDGNDLAAEDPVRMAADIKLLGINSIACYNMGGFDPDYLIQCERSVGIRDMASSLYDLPFFPTVSIGWDDSPRFPAKGASDVTRIHNTPTVFASYLQKAKEFADGRRDKQPPFIMINAWNEWVEASYLLPDRVNGYGYLEAVRDVLDGKYE